MTTLDINFSQGFQQEVSSDPSLWIYAVVYDNNNTTTGTWTTLVANGSVETTPGSTTYTNGTTTLVGNWGTAVDLPATLDSGKIYLIVQDSSGPFALQQQVTSESVIDLTNAANDHFVYDSMEVNLTGGTGGNAVYDVGNLTSVAGFSLPMELSVPYSDGTTASVGYNLTQAQMIQALTANEGGVTSDITNFLTGPLAADFPTALSPASVISAATPNPPGVTFQSSNWDSYVLAVGSLADSKPIELSGVFNGAKDNNGTYHNSGYFTYGVSYDPSATVTVNGTVETGVFMLTPSGTSQIQGVIALGTAELEQSIYSTLGTAEVFNSTADVLNGVAPAYTIGTGANDQWGAVLRSFLVGFTAGYYGGNARTANPQTASTFDLNSNINWDPTYAFGGGTVTLDGTVTPLVTSDVTVSGAGQVSYDPYAQVFFQDSNSYGAGYSDALMSAFPVGGPLVSVYDNTTSADVATLDLTLFGINDQPSGYTRPQMYNYIAPGAGTYDVPDTTATGANVKFNFASGAQDNAGMVLDPMSTVTLEILTADVGGVAQWGTVTLDGSATTDINGTLGEYGLWRQWTIEGDATSGYTAVATGSVYQAGNLLINDFPVVASGTATEWYRIGVDGKTFDLYTVTQNGSFDNAAYNNGTINQAGSIAIDGLASIASPLPAQETASTFTVNFANASGIVVDPQHVVVNTAALGTRPDAPVAGVMSNSTFEALAGQSLQATNTIATAIVGANIDVAFGWTGLNSDPGTASWISGFTNKVGAGDTVTVTIAPAGNIAHAQYATATADLDGAWQTGTVALGAGTTYDITMAAYQPGVTGAVTPQSQTLVLDVACFAAGTRILAARGEVAVEDLAVGEPVWSHGAGLTPVRWLGRRHIDCRRHARPRDVAPVRVLRDAFAPGVPHRDLLLSPDHAVFAEGVLIPVRYLVNGCTVRREAVDAVTYHHVELAAHDVILAEGLACESYLDTGNRAIFENASGAKADDAFALAVWESGACARLVLKGPELAAARRMLLARAEELGHAMTRDPALRVVADGRVLRPHRTGRVARFRLPAAGDVRLVSRSAVPAETGMVEDHRQLGVAVAEIRLDGETIGLGDARLGEGWHAIERGADSEAWRWTDGEASLVLERGGVLEVEVALTEAYWR